MSHAEICPICGGFGRIRTNTDTTGGSEEEICHGCGGVGWVVVDDNYPILPSPFIPPNTKWTITVNWERK